MQALLSGQSELTAHSGRQAGGEPMYPARQEQAPRLFTILHSLFGPHGDGSQGLKGNAVETKNKRNYYLQCRLHIHKYVNTQKCFQLT